MSISLTIGDQSPLSLNTLKDLANAATLTNLKLGQEFAAFLNQPLSALPANLSSTALQYSGGPPTWTPGIGGTTPISFTLSGGVCGKVSVITSGSLLTYTDGFPQTVSAGLSTPVANANTTKQIPVPAGQAFVALEMDFQISGGLTGSYQQGIYGVTTADSAAASISVAFYKSCASYTKLEDAVQQAFEGFVLPLHEKTLEHMSPGDYLHYNFNANLQLGLGASIGYDKVFYAGTTTQAIPGTAGAVTLTAAVQPEVQAGAKFCFSYSYTGTFEIVLWCDAGQKAHLHLFRSNLQDTTVSGNLGLMLTSGTSASVAVSTSQVMGLLTKSMPPNLQSTFSSAVASKAQAEVDKYVGELNDKIASWLTRVNNQKATLDMAIDHTSSKFLLTDYTIDLGNANYGAAWKLMLGGHFLDAMETPNCGVTLATGSGVEALFNTAASVKLNLFGALHAAWTTTTLSSSSLIYAGNNVFHLVTVEGKDVLTVINATQKEMTVYFAAEADVSTAGSRIGAPKLHCLLQATNSPRYGKSIAQLVGRLSSGPGIAALAGNVAAVAQGGKGTETLHLVFGPDAYGKLNAAAIQHGKPDDESKDASNYAAFQSACAGMYTTDPQGFSWSGRPLTYSLWRDTWIASNDQWPAADGAVPNRRENAGCGSGVMSQLGQELGGSAGSDGEAQMIFYTLEAATQFMNLCDDLRTLASSTIAYTPATWTSFVAELGHIIKNDLNTDFMPATMLALASLCGGAPTAVSGPVAGLPSGSSIGVTMTYGASG